MLKFDVRHHWVQVKASCTRLYLKPSQRTCLARFGSSFDTHTTMDAIILSASHIQYQAIEYYSIHTLSYCVVRIKLNTTNQEHTRLTLDGPRYKNALTRTQAGLPYCCLCNLIHAIATLAIITITIATKILVVKWKR